jgi:hypothetical protein
MKKSLVVSLAVLLSGCDRENGKSSTQATHYPKTSLCLNLVSGMSNKEFSDSLLSFTNHNKVIKPEKLGNGEMLYEMDINNKGGYLFKIGPSFLNNELYMVTLRYCGTFHRMMYQGQELVSTDLPEDVRYSTINDQVIKECVTLLHQKYGESIPDKYNNQYNWIADNKSVVLSYNRIENKGSLEKELDIEKDPRDAFRLHKIVNLSIYYTDILRDSIMHNEQRSQVKEGEKVVDERVQKTKYDL